MVVKALDSHMADCHSSPVPGGPAVSVMAMSLDSHVVNCGSNPRPGGSNSRWARVRAFPRSREENGGEGIAARPSPLGGDFSLSVSLSLSVCLASTRAL